MHRTGMGWVDFVWGDIGGAVKPSGSRSGQKGLAHIIEARSRKNGMTKAEVTSLLFDMVETIAQGRESLTQERNGERKARITHQ